MLCSQDAPASACNARARNVRKKLAEIAALENRLLSEPDSVLTAEQEEKLDRRLLLEAELEELLRAPAVLLEEEPMMLSQTPTSTVLHRSPALHPRSPTLHPRSPGLTAMMSPSMRWRDDPVHVEDVEMLDYDQEEEAKHEWEFIEALQPFTPATRANERLKALCKLVTELSRDAFEEDALEMVTKKGKWKLTLMARPDSSARSPNPKPCPEEDFPLIGFVVYRLRQELQALSIAKLAIVPEHRMKGHGHRIIDWCVRLARKQPAIGYVALSSLPDAVRFYERLGFRKHDVNIAQKLAPDEDYVEGQVYMEKIIKGKGRRKK